MGIFSSKTRRETASGAPGVPPGVRIYAIGDLHGRADLLDSLANKIARDLARSPCPGARAILLGDYIDRGPDSFGVVDRLATGRFPVPVTALRGNHEAVLLEFLDDAKVFGSWFHYGGAEMLASYGVESGDARAARRELLEKMPPEHLAFFRATRLSESVGDYYFCHAGVRPQVALEAQQERDLLWIRGEFLNFQGAFGKIVVHGHTPTPLPQVTANRIGIDTKAWATGKLACLTLEGRKRRWIAA